jgi:hypothetical protein
LIDYLLGIGIIPDLSESGMGRRTKFLPGIRRERARDWEEPMRVTAGQNGNPEEQDVKYQRAASIQWSMPDVRTWVKRYYTGDELSCRPKQ